MRNEESMSEMALETVIDNSTRAALPSWKRALDLIVCLLAMPFVLLCSTLIALAIVLDSRGPIIFSQERVGVRGRRFSIYKFRTMRSNRESSGDRRFMQEFIRGEVRGKDLPRRGSLNKPDHDQDLTRFGPILRRTGLDELPQIINVLAGEMSLVGPRPSVPCEVAVYRPLHWKRLAVLPGITGLAQVRGRSSLTFHEIVSHDLEYIEKQSLWLDLKILGLTLFCVLTGRGAG